MKSGNFDQCIFLGISILFKRKGTKNIGDAAFGFIFRHGATVERLFTPWREHGEIFTYNYNNKWSISLIY